jgi:hypothetical protein
MLQMNEMKQRIDRIEECADEALEAAQGNAPAGLRECVESIHTQAKQAQQSLSGGSQQQMDQNAVRQQVMQLEQTGDRAMQACRQAGNVSPQLQQAVQRAHDEISQLKKEIQMQ